MDVKILDGIIHGDLKPWQIDISSKKKFAALLSTAIPKKTSDLLAQVKALVKDFPESKKKADALPASNGNAITQHFYKTDLPGYTDSITQFYSLLISKEALRFFNAYLEKAATLTEPVDITYHAKQSLKSIRTLANQASKEIRDLSKLDISDAQKQIVQFALLTLKQTLTALFFDVQERFKDSLKELITEENFYILYLDETPPASPQLKSTASLFEFQLNNLLTADKYIENTAHNLLKQIQQHQPEQSQRLQAAFENLIFLQSQKEETTSLTIEEITDIEKTKQHFEAAKKSIITAINQYTYGHQRLDVISAALNKLDYTQPGFENKFSIPASLYKWLQQQKEVYTQNASNVFAAEEIKPDIFNKKKKPLSKQDKPTVEQNKQFANEHLHFLSGVDIRQQKIMGEPDFKRLIEYTFYLIETEKLPATIKQIPQIGISTQHIRYTYYLIHKGLYGTQEIKKEWIDFLHQIFKQFSNTEWNTTKTKFSTKPAKYDSDMKSLKK